MIIDLRKPYQWDELNESVKNTLHFEGTTKVFQSVSQAIFEIAMSIKNLYAHKSQFYYSLGLGTHADEGILYLARQGTKGIEFPADQPPVIEDKKTLFWLCDVDDAITGQLYHESSTSVLDPKVYRIWVSHRKHFVQAASKSISDNDICIFGADGGPVIAHFGKRAQALQMLLAPTLNWQGYTGFSGFALSTEQKAWVEGVEKGSWAGSEVFFAAQVPRLYDRAILVWKDLDASAIRDLLIKNHQVNPNHVEAIGLNRWNEAKLIPQFEKRQMSSEVFRGTLLLSAALAADSNIKKKVEDAVSALKKMSSL